MCAERPRQAGPHHYNPNYIPTASWTYPATSRMMFEAGLSAQIVNQHDKREPGFPETNIQITDQGLNLTYGNIPTRTLPRRQYQERFSVAYVTGSHNFKTGMTLRDVTIGDIDSLGTRPLDAQRVEDLPVQQRRAEPGHASPTRRGTSKSRCGTWRSTRRTSGPSGT